MSESTPPASGMRARTSASASTAGESPAPSVPSRRARRSCPAAGDLGDVDGAGVGRHRDERESGRAQRREAGRQRLGAGLGEAQRLAHRDAQRAAVERVARVGVEQQRVDAERRGAAHDRAHVRVVVDVLEHDDAAGAAYHLGHARQRLAVERGEHAAVHREARDRAHELVAGRVHGHALGRQAPEALAAAARAAAASACGSRAARARSITSSPSAMNTPSRAPSAPPRAGGAWRRAGARTRARAGREGRRAPSRLNGTVWA